jgi:DNA-binding response OmpR family regulator
MALKALIVYKDSAVAALIGEAFSSVGLEVRSAGSFPEAFQLVSQERYDGIFVDPGTPLLEGCELAKSVRQSRENHGAPIFILTVQSPTYATAQAFDVCGTFYLQEPIDFDSLAHLLAGTSGTPPDNRRRKVRGPLETEVTRRTIHVEFKGMSSDISEDGILFQSDGSLATGQEVELLFELPDQKPEIRVVGIVARLDAKDGKRALVCFTQIPSAARRRIKDFVAATST